MSNPGFPSRHYRKPKGTAAMCGISTIFSSFKEPADIALLHSIEALQEKGETLAEIADILKQPIDKVRAVVLTNLERSP